MKKTLLSVLAGLTVMNVAFADEPSVEDRKKLCQLLIDKGTHVWVEKTSACIPVNPCASETDININSAYCLEIPIPNQADKRKLVFDKYAEKALKTTVTSIKNLPPDSTEPDRSYYGVQTADGGYFAAFSEAYGYDDCLSFVVQSALAYGAFNQDCFNSWMRDVMDSAGAPKSYVHKVVIYTVGQRCNEIQEFAKTLSGKQIGRDTSTTLCKLTCVDE